MPGKGVLRGGHAWPRAGVPRTRAIDAMEVPVMPQKITRSAAALAALVMLASANQASAVQLTEISWTVTGGNFVFGPNAPGPVLGGA